MCAGAARDESANPNRELTDAFSWCRAARNRGLTTVAINDPQLGAKYASFLLTHDTVMGRFEGEVSTSTERDDCFLIDGEPVHVTQRTDPGEVYIQTEIPRYRRKIS